MSARPHKNKNPERAFLRILDANYNRAKEAFRVSEDLVRFLMDEKALTSEFKSCRHSLTRIFLRFPVSYKKLLESRRSASDVGREGWIKDKSGKVKWQDLLSANLKRAQEALRVLEEISKAVAPASSPHFQKLRFRTYELERKTLQKL